MSKQEANEHVLTPFLGFISLGLLALCGIMGAYIRSEDVKHQTETYLITRQYQKTLDSTRNELFKGWVRIDMLKYTLNNAYMTYGKIYNPAFQKAVNAALLDKQEDFEFYMRLFKEDSTKTK